MRTRITSLVVAGSVVVVVTVATRTAARDLTTPPEVATFRANEVVRVRAHFDSVLLELTSNGDSLLTPAKRDRRAALLTTLRAYKERGEFPRNYDFPGRQVPSFVDRKTGVRCAVAHLLESTGRTDIVRRVAATNNSVRVPELAGDTAFTAWVDSSGLTLAEAARIQPSYEQDRRERDQYAMVSTVTISTSVVATFVNLTANGDGQSRTVSAVGLLLGTGTFGFGLLGQGGSDTQKVLGIVNMAVGSASTIAAVRSIFRRSEAGANANVETATAAPGRQMRASVAPTLSLTGPRTVGVAVHVRF